MNLVDLVNRLLGRTRDRPEVTPPEVRDMILQRQDEQEARLRRLDLQAGMPDRQKHR